MISLPKLMRVLLDVEDIKSSQKKKNVGIGV